MIFFIFDKNSNLFTTNNANGASKCCNECPTSGTQKQYCKIQTANVRSGSRTLKNGFTIQLCSANACDSTSIWKQRVEILSELIPTITLAHQKANLEAGQDVDRLLHNLKKFNAHCIQIGDYFIGPSQSRYVNSSQQESVKNFLLVNPDKSAEQLLLLVKNSRLMQAEISVFDKLYKNEEIILRPTKHLVHRVVNSIYRIFYNSFAEKHVRVYLLESSAEILVDYETFTVSLTHMIENMTKYIMPYSEARIYFESHGEKIHIIFAMTSLQILDSELEHIFQEGHSGQFSTKLGLKGSGVGMFIIKQFMKLNNGEFEVKVNLNTEEVKYYDNTPYQDNLFILKVPKAEGNYRNNILI